MFIGLLQLIGVFWLAGTVARAARWLWQYAWLSGREQGGRLAERYGRGSWVLITGAGDGLGKAFAQQFARAGFNLLLISRTEEKLRRLQAELEAGGVQVRALAADLSDLSEQTTGAIVAAVSEVELSIVVNCVGATVHRRYGDIPLGTLHRLLSVNVGTTAVLTHAMLPLLLRRAEVTGRRCALLNVGSIVGRFYWPGTQLYSACKVFVDHLTVPLGAEYRDRIDVLSFQPTVMATAMATGTEPAAITISPEAAAQAALAHLGRFDRSHGHWRHAALAALLSALPRRLRDGLFLSEALKMGEVEIRRG